MLIARAMHGESLPATPTSDRGLVPDASKAVLHPRSLAGITPETLEQRLAESRAFWRTLIGQAQDTARRAHALAGSPADAYPHSKWWVR